jgi:hypothetical protein
MTIKAVVRIAEKIAELARCRTDAETVISYQDYHTDGQLLIQVTLILLHFTHAKVRNFIIQYLNTFHFLGCYNDMACASCQTVNYRSGCDTCFDGYQPYLCPTSAIFNEQVPYWYSTDD